jgi:uncharacterized protein YdhG (YjbR/CyaY superfamily)
MTDTSSTRAGSFTAEERAAMRERNKELKTQQSKEADLAAVLAKIEGMGETDKALAAKVHEIVLSAKPELAAKLWYGSPAYYLDGKLICFFQESAKFKTRYPTVGFSDSAQLDDGTMWPTSYAVTQVTSEVGERIRDLVGRAVG